MAFIDMFLGALNMAWIFIVPWGVERLLVGAVPIRQARLN